MKKIIFLLSIIVFLGFTSLGSATLINLGNGLIKDDKETINQSDDQYWISDTSQFVGMTYAEQITAIAKLNVSDYGLNPLWITSFHMASQLDVFSLWNSYDADTLASLFTSTAVNPVEETIWWALRYDEIAYINGQSPYEGDYFHHQTLLKYYINGAYAEKRDNASCVWDESREPGAWVVAYYVQPTATPEPATMLLLGLGLSGLVRLRRKLKEQI